MNRFDRNVVGDLVGLRVIFRAVLSVADHHSHFSDLGPMLEFLKIFSAKYLAKIREI
jgi:hypothetical protein